VTQEIESPSELRLLSVEDIESICEGNNLPKSSKFEMIGLLLDQLQEKVTNEELKKFSVEELRDMCKSRELSYQGQKEDMIQRLFNSVRGIPTTPAHKPEPHAVSKEMGDDQDDDYVSKKVTRKEEIKTGSDTITKKEVTKVESVPKSRRRSFLNKLGLGWRSDTKATGAKSPYDPKKNVTGKRKYGSTFNYEDEYNSKIKKRKTMNNYSMTHQQFIEKAPKINLKIEGTNYKIDPRIFSSTNTLGWYTTGRQTIKVDGKPLTVAWSMNMTVLGDQSDE